MKSIDLLQLGGLPLTQNKFAFWQRGSIEAFIGIAKALAKKNVNYTILSGAEFLIQGGQVSITEGWVLWKNEKLVRLEPMSFPFQAGATLYLNYAHFAVGAPDTYQDSSLHEVPFDENLKLSYTNNGNDFEIFDTQNRFELLLGGGVPVGTMNMWAAAAIPLGWLPCEGQVLNFITNPEYLPLFGLLGFSYGNGGGAAGAFNLPDMRGKFPLGASNDYPLGSNGGEKEKILVEANLPPHVHQIDEDVHSHNSKFPGVTHVANNVFTNGTPVADSDPARAVDMQTSVNTANVPQNTGDGHGTSLPFSILNPYLGVHFIMKVF